MGKIVAVVNQKGGVGKTTSAVNLAAALGEHGKSVLLCDFDPQGNATSGLGISKRGLKRSSGDVLVGTDADGNAVTAADCVQKTPFAGLSVLPASIDLAGTEIRMVDLPRREYRLRDALAPLRSEYDYILIDCPPSLGLLTLDALVAADTFLVPIQCEYFALEGLSQLMATVRQIKRLYNPLLDLEGVLLTMYDARLNLTNQVVAEVKKFFPKKIFRSPIPRSVRLSEAPSFGQPITVYDKRSKGCVAYMDVAKEMIKKN